MDFFPVFLDLKNKACLVVGGGDVASRKVHLLLKAGAAITVVSPRLQAKLEGLVASGKIAHIPGDYQSALLGRSQLVIAATDSDSVNAQIATDANARSIPVNVVDQPELGSFIIPSIIDRSPMVAAVSTGGSSPVLARLARSRLESMIPAAYGRLAELANRYRDAVKARISSPDARKRFWEDVLQGPIAEMVFAGQTESADKALLRRLDNASGAEQSMGEVYLVGGGPGDPDLLTFRALRLMQQADVVVYDRLVASAVLDLTRRDAERIYVGKERDNHAMRQEEINNLLARLAKQGKRVLRLKGGDPFIFGRGGEEIDTLAAQGVPFQVVPGITAASGCASYAGIPLTHRDYAQSCVFVTGHLKDGTANLNWEMLAQPHQTVVLYMGLLGLPIICRELTAHGVPPQMPVALIQQGTTPHQKVYTGTLDTISEIVKAEKPKPPTLIIVGEVVKLHEKLAWFSPATSAEDAPYSLPPQQQG